MTLEKTIIAEIGEAGMIALAEAFGGVRLYIPRKAFLSTAEGNAHAHGIVEAVGLDAARILSDLFAPGTIRVPMARELRAKHYRQEGASNPRIAVRLGMTERGVERLFKRLAVSDGAKAALP